MAGSCKADNNVCARCAGHHKTLDCTTKDRSEYKCANSKQTGHGAADRNCPIFIAKSKELRTRVADLRYRFFPTDDPATWEPENAEDDDAVENMGRTGDAREQGQSLRREKDQRSRTTVGDLRSRPRDNGYGQRKGKLPETARETRGPREEAGLSFHAPTHTEPERGQAPRLKQTQLEETMPQAGPSQRREGHDQANNNAADAQDRHTDPGRGTETMRGRDPQPPLHV
jgi:hypothetical protein